MKKFILTGITAFSLTTFIACGGGGGGSNNNSDALTFPSNAVVAEPTIKNGKEVKDTTVKNQTEGISMLNAVSNESNLNAVSIGNNISTKIFKLTQKNSLNSYYLNKVINETENCSNGGTITYNGAGEEEKGGYINLTANNCNDGDSIVNGSIYAVLSNYDSNVDNYKYLELKFTSNFSIEDVSKSTAITISKNSKFIVNVNSYDSYNELKNFNLDISFIATDGSKTVGLKNCKFNFDKIDSQKIKWYMTQGKIYINNLSSYVTYDTNYDMSKTPFIIDKSNDNIESGEAHFNMANNGKLKIIAENGEAKVYIDANGDGTYELNETMQ